MEDFYKEIIMTNFDLFKIKFNEAQSKPSISINFQLNGYDINLFYLSEYYIILIVLNNGEKYKFQISKYLRKMNFKQLNNDHWHFIFSSEDIRKYIQKYNFEHPTYFDKKKNKNVTISSKDYCKVFQDNNIIQISDDLFIEYISKNEFGSLYWFRGKEKIKTSDLYLNIPNDNISQSINNDEILLNDKRSELVHEIYSFVNEKNKKLFWLSGGKKIGKTITIRYTCFYFNIFYFNFKNIQSMQHACDKKKNIYRECMNLFINKAYEDFNEFYEKIKTIKGYNMNIWDLLNNYIEKISENNILNQIIILDDYDDLYINVDNEEIMNENIINNFSKYKNLKYIICGNGKYINTLILNYLSGNNYDQKYKISYYNDFGLELKGKKVYNLLYEVDKESYKNELKEYFNKKYKNKAELLLKLISFEELLRINHKFQLNDDFLNELPIQFFKIIYNKEMKYFNVNYLCEDFYNIYDFEIQFLITQKIKINVNSNQDLNNLAIIKGCILERFIIGLIETNKLLKDMYIPEDNIIRIDEIYNINENDLETKENIKDNYPILIKQNKEGAYYDFALIIKNKEEIYGLLIQVGLNKKKSEISKIFLCTTMNYDILIKGLKKLTGQKIKQLSLLFIFDKEKQDSLFLKLNKYNCQLKGIKDEYLINEIKNKISSIYIGRQFTKELFIPYLEFSYGNNLLYLNNKTIDNKEALFKTFWPIINFQEETKNKIDKLLSEDYKEFSNQLIKIFEYENVSEIKILMEINDYKKIIKKIPEIFIIIFILNDYKLIIFKDETIHYLLYNRNKHFEVIKIRKFNQLIKNKPYQMFLCEKLFNEKETFMEEQGKEVAKRKVDSYFKEEKKEREKKMKNNRKKKPQNK